MWSLYLTHVLLLFTCVVRSEMDLGEQIKERIQANLRGMDTLGDLIGMKIHESLKPLESLNDKISSSVEKSLQPVRAMEMRVSMANGVGGTTIKLFSESERLIVVNYKQYVCQGDIVYGEPFCTGTVVPFEIKNKTDFCYATSYAVIENRVCLGNGGVKLSIINNNYTCSSIDGSPTLSTTKSKYRKMCGGKLPGEAVYTYFANRAHPNAIKIPNENPLLHCLNQDEGICTFTKVFE